MSESESNPPEVHAAPRQSRATVAQRGPSERYFRDLSESHPLTREGEIAIGRRCEEGQLAVIEAWVRSPVALRELALTSEDLELGALGARDLLLDPGTDEPAAEAAAARLTRLLEVARALHTSPRPGAEGTIALAGLASGLASLRLDPVVGDRIDRCLRAAAAEGTRAERTAIEATLEEIAAARRAVARARTELVEANLRLAVSIARRFHRVDLPLLDLVQEANLGLMRAADRFDHRRGYRFGTYAVWWIKQAIGRALLAQGRAVRIPAHLSQTRSRVLRARRELLQERGREPSEDEVAERTGLPVEKVRMIAELGLEPLSLDAPVGDEGDTRFGDLLAGVAPSADESFARHRLAEQTRAMLESLTPREQEVLRRRYGLDGNEDETLEQIGQSFSLTRERVRQIEAKALEKLRPRSAQRKLGSYLVG